MAGIGLPPTDERLRQVLAASDQGHGHVKGNSSKLATWTGIGAICGALTGSALSLLTGAPPGCFPFEATCFADELNVMSIMKGLC